MVTTKTKNNNPRNIIINYLKNISGNSYYSKISFVPICNNLLLKEINEFLQNDSFELKVLYKMNDICIGLIKKNNPFTFFIFNIKENNNEIIYKPIGYIEFMGKRVIAKIKYDYITNALLLN